MLVVVTGVQTCALPICYPDCDFMTWDMPVATKCEKCGSTLFRKGSKLYCAKEGCDFEMPVPKKD